MICQISIILTPAPIFATEPVTPVIEVTETPEELLQKLEQERSKENSPLSQLNPQSKFLLEVLEIISPNIAIVKSTHF